jgi:hypothetical protein
MKTRINTNTRINANAMSRRLQMGALVVLALLGLMPIPAARAQGCVLCYTSLSAASPGAMHAFQLAMLVLLFPALLLFAGLFLLIFRHRQTEDADEWPTPVASALNDPDLSPLA